MSENKIKKAIDGIEPENGARERMYRNIIKKAQLQGSDNAADADNGSRPASDMSENTSSVMRKAPNVNARTAGNDNADGRQIVSADGSAHRAGLLKFVRRALPIAACFCLIAVGVARFALDDSRRMPDESGVQGGSPFVDVSSADAFADIGIKLDAPAGSDNAEYAVIDGSIASVRFMYDGVEYTARASAQNGDFSGVNGRELSSESVDAKNDAVLTVLLVDETEYQKVTWTDGRNNYCLLAAAADGNAIIDVYKAISAE